MAQGRSGWSVIVIAGVTLLFCIVAAYPIGMSHAYLARLVGVQTLMGYGLCNGPCGIAEDILLERYGIHTIRVAGCVVWGPEMWYSDGFNRVMMRSVVRDRGADVFLAAGEEAKATYQSRRARRQEDL